MKEELLQYCQNYVQDRIDRFSGAIAEAQSGANNETKSSAGDKHETGRAMAQLETENNSRHLAEAKKLKGVLSQINPAKQCDKVELGALVETSNVNFFISVSAGKTIIKGKPHFFISASSPLAQAMLGKKSGDTYVINGQVTQIGNIL